MLAILFGAIVVLVASTEQQSVLQLLDARPQRFKDFFGNSPLKYCNKSRPTDLFWVDRIEVQPEHLYM